MEYDRGVKSHRCSRNTYVLDMNIRKPIRRGRFLHRRRPAPWNGQRRAARGADLMACHVRIPGSLASRANSRRRRGTLRGRTRISSDRATMSWKGRWSPPAQRVERRHALRVDGHRWSVEAENLWERWPVWSLPSPVPFDVLSVVRRPGDGSHRTSSSGWGSRDDGIWNRTDGRPGNPVDQTC